VTTPTAAKKGLGSARVTAAAIAAIIAALVFVLATRSPSGDGFGVSPLLGKRAPETLGVDVLTGKKVSLTGLQSVGVAGASGQRPFAIVNFFGTWCPPCATEHPQLKAFSDEHAKTGDAFLFAVAYQDTPKDIKAFFAKRGGGWPVVDSDRSAVDWGVLKAPETYIVDPDGIVAAKVNGAVTQDGLNRLLDRLRAGPTK
jgi:cytochrome c biogenesis protein CcmG, thiol:disulfide interchange protein DsbE